MPVSVTASHALSATTPNDPNYEIQPQHWNSGHLVTAALSIEATEISGLFSNVGGVSWGTADGKVTASVKTDYLTTQTVQTQASGNLAGIGFTTATTAGTEVKGTLSTNGLSLGIPAYLTAAEAAAGGAGTGATTATTAGTQVKATLGTDGLSLAYPAALTTAQPVGNYLTTARASNDAVGLNTALTANGVAWTVNSSGISLNVPAFLTTAALSNHSHGNPTLALTNLSGTTASNSAGFTLSLSAAAPGGGAAPVNRSMFEIVQGERLTTACPLTNASLSKRPIFVPFWMDGEGLIPKTIRLYGHRTAGTTLNCTLGAALYSLVNSTQISLQASATQAYSLTASALWAGVRIYEFTQFSSVTLSEGRWIMALYGSGSNNSTAVMNLNFYGGDAMPAVAGSVHAGSNSTGATDNTNHFFPFWGVYSNTTAGFPGSVARTQVFGANSNYARDVYAALLEI